MSSIALIIPCYNEANRLIKEEFSAFLIKNEEYHIFFIDDGSRDATFEKLLELKSLHPEQITILQNIKNKGKGESVRKGMREACQMKKFDYIGYLDADLSTPLVEFVSLTNYLISHKKKAVFGSRLKIGGTKIDRSPVRHVIGRFFATLVSWTIQLPFYDTQCGAKVFDATTISLISEKAFVSRWLFDVEIILRLKSLWGEEIFTYLHEYPLKIWQQVDGSKITLLDGLKVPFELLKIKAKYLNQQSVS